MYGNLVTNSGELDVEIRVSVLDLYLRTQFLLFTLLIWVQAPTTETKSSMKQKLHVTSDEPLRGLNRKGELPRIDRQNHLWNLPHKLAMD